MAAAATDLVRKKKSNFSTTLSSSIDDTTSTVPISSKSGLPTDTGVTLTVDRVDANGNSTPSKMERFTGVVNGSSNQIDDAVRGDEGTAQSHAAGAIVEDIWEAATWNDICTAFLVSHTQAGNIKSGAQIDDINQSFQYQLSASVLSADRVVALPALNSADTFVFEKHPATLEGKTLLSPVLNSGVSGTAIDTEVTLSANLDTKIPSQKAVKTYVDSKNRHGMYQNLITNGNFDVAQRGTSFTSATTPANNDDTYLLDEWNLVSDGNDAADISQVAVTDLPGSNYAIAIDIETAKRVGIAQFIEAKDAQKFKGKTVSLSFAVKSANIAALRATLLSWASTADVITSDVVSAWGATPTWATNWADNITPADLVVTSGWTTVKIEGIVLDEATINNLALVIWTPNEETIGDIVYISQIQINEGEKATPYSPKSYAQELRDCQRHYWQVAVYDLMGMGIATNQVKVYCDLPEDMRIKPTCAVVGTYVFRLGATDQAALIDSFTATGNTTTHQWGIFVNDTGAGFTAGGAYRLANISGNINASAVL